jgi:dienelactone hydrolase
MVRMGMRFSGRALAAVVLVALAVAGSARAEDPSPGTPSWYARSAENHLYAQGRWIDQLTNPDYLSKALSATPECVAGLNDLCFFVDPYRRGWGTTRGTMTAVSWKNRYGVDIAGTLYLPALPFTDPVTGDPSNGPFPAVIIVPGLGAAHQPYSGIAQGLAESGYAVLAFDPQCQGRSGCQPAEEFCDPAGPWREPQEMGIRERGACAGMVPAADPATDPAGFVQENVAFGLYGAGCMTNGCDEDNLAGQYQDAAPTFVFGALDAVGWLLSDENPERTLIDHTRVGLAGHSMGAYGALMAANGDPSGRFHAAVPWDGYGRMSDLAVSPTVPTMIQMAENEEAGGPFRSPPDPDEKTPSENARGFVEAGVDVAAIALRGSTHQEWVYNPFYMNAQLGQFVASRHGERVGLYYTLAWFDRYLKGATTAIIRGDEAAQATDARSRLIATAFDTSADRSSIGQGRWDPATRVNVPYLIGGAAVADHLSFYFRSFYAFDGLSCQDIRIGCN